MQEKTLSEKESLDLIASMINKAKDSYHDTGIGAIMWGVVISTCSLVRLAEIHFGFSLPFNIYWLTLVAIIPQVFITLRQRRERKVKAYDDIYIDYLWLGFGISIFLLSVIIGSIFHVWEPVAIEYNKLAGHRSPFRFSEFETSLFLLLYGMPTFVTGAACKFKPMLWGGVICWILCIVTLQTPIKIDLLLTAVAAIISWLIPGIIMEKQYRNAKQQLAAKNV